MHGETIKFTVTKMFDKRDFLVLFLKIVFVTQVKQLLIAVKR